jgi:HEAT repeat protein
MGRWRETKAVSRDEALVPLVEAALDDPHPAVVARSLRTMPPSTPIAWPRLRAALVHEEAAVRRAAWAVMKWRDDAAPEEMLRLAADALRDDDLTVRVLAVDCLGSVEARPGLAAAFRKALADDHVWVRSKAVHAISFHSALYTGLRELVPDLVAKLDESPSNAADALGKLGEAATAALPRLRELLANAETREDAAVAIWRIEGDPEPLFAFVRESSAAGSPRGFGALGELGSLARPLAPDVAKGLSHEERWARRAAARCLGKIGGDAARSALRERLAVEADSMVVEAIRKALDGLEGNGPGGGR